MQPLKTCIMLITSLIILAQLQIAEAGWDPKKQQKRMASAERAVAAFLKKDPGLKTFFNQAYGYAVFPSIAKGAFVVGVAHGNGVVYQHGRATGVSTLSQATVGLQAGGQAYSEIIFFKDQKAYSDFTTGSFTLSAQVSAVAANQGAAANIDYSAGVAVFTLAKGGLMYEASVGGQKFSYSSLSGQEK